MNDTQNIKDPKEVEAFAYAANEGVSKRRLMANGEARKTFAWSTVCILSGERSMVERIEAAGHSTGAGAKVRVAVVRTDDASKFALSQIKEFERILDHYGHAGPAFVPAFIEAYPTPEDADAAVNGWIDRILKQRPQLASLDGDLVSTKQVTPQDRRAARVLGYMGVAGMVAAKAGLLRLNAIWLEEYLRGLWKGMSSGIEAPEEPVLADTEKLIEAIGGRINFDIVDVAEEKRYREAVGYYNDAFPVGGTASKPQLGRAYILRTSQLDALTGGLTSSRYALARYLVEKGIAIPKSQGRNTWDSLPGLAGRSFLVIRGSAVDGGADDTSNANEVQAEPVSASCG